ncbi:UNVERIFIED_CONTAM: sigma factor [Kocuria sp. CPCC 205295]|uniref:RNA polymerase sigma factor n=1 Tax=Kocuria sp. CPCC 205295 TaxID=3073557 RepID=UPI0036DDF7EA
MAGLDNPQQTAGRLVANSPEAWQAVLETMEAVSPVIRSVLGPAGFGSEAEDIEQETIISAVKGIGRWSATEGPLVAWVTMIGKRRAIDFIRRQKHMSRTAVVFAGQGGDEDDAQVIDVAEASFEEQFLDREEAWATVESVLGQVQLLLRNRETVARALVVLVRCDGDVAEASRLMGLPEPMLREARRETVRMALVVRNALRLHDGGGKVGMTELWACLPDGVGSWTRVVAVEVAKAGGVERVRASVVAKTWGWSESTARQRIVDTLWLLSVARTLGEGGRIIPQQKVAC